MNVMNQKWESRSVRRAEKPWTNIEEKTNAEKSMSWTIKETIGWEKKTSVRGRKKISQTTAKKASSRVKKASTVMITEVMITKTVNGSKAEVNRKKTVVI